MSDDKEKPAKNTGKHAEPDWPEDTGKALDEWLRKSNEEAEGK